jgi:hypothetical protein
MINESINVTIILSKPVVFSSLSSPKKRIKRTICPKITYFKL